MAQFECDSFRSTLAGDHDYLFENCCDLCEPDELQKEAVGFCVDCQDYLCTECFRNHLKPKPCRNHVVLDMHQMPSREAKKTRAQNIMDIQVKSSDDRMTPSISGCVVLPGDKLVVVDRNNAKVKLIDPTHNKIVSQIELPGAIGSITQVSCTQVAVTSYNNQTIYVVNVEANQLKLDRKVNVEGQCHGIASINNNIVVSYDEPVKVEIISLKGQVLQTLLTEDKGRQLFQRPLYVAVSKDHQVIYISDQSRNTVFSIDLTGQVQATYDGFVTRDDLESLAQAAYEDENCICSDDKLWHPRGLTVDSAGRVYVCGVSTANIRQLTANLTEIQDLLQPSEGVSYPESVCFSEATERLYIGMMGKDVVKVYQLE